MFSTDSLLIASSSTEEGSQQVSMNRDVNPVLALQVEVSEVSVFRDVGHHSLKGDIIQLGVVRHHGLPVVDQKDGDFLLILSDLGDLCSEEILSGFDETVGTEDRLDSAWRWVGLTVSEMALISLSVELHSVTGTDVELVLLDNGSPSVQD